MTPKSVSQNKSSSSWLNTAYICWIIYLSLITLVLRCQFPAHSSGTVDSSRHLSPSAWHCTITFFPTIKTFSKMGPVLILGKKQLLTIFPSEEYELLQHFPSSLMIWLLQKKKKTVHLNAYYMRGTVSRCIFTKIPVSSLKKLSLAREKDMETNSYNIIQHKQSSKWWRNVENKVMNSLLEFREDFTGEMTFEQGFKGWIGVHWEFEKEKGISGRGTTHA